MNARCAWLLLVVVALGSWVTGCSGKGDDAPADTADAVVEQVVNGIADGEPQVLWQALPPSYREDVSALIRQSADGMDAELWNKSFDVVQKLTQVLDEKRDFILDHPMISSSLDDRGEAEAAWAGLVGLLEIVANSELSDLESFRNLDVESFLSGTGSKLLTRIADVSALAPGDSWQREMGNLKKIKASVVSEEGDSALVRIERPDGNTAEERFVRVEGHWVPEKLALGWDKKIAEAMREMKQKSSTWAGENRQATLMQLTMVESMLESLRQADTEQEFQAALGPAMGMVIGAAMANAKPTSTPAPVFNEPVAGNMPMPGNMPMGGGAAPGGRPPMPEMGMLPDVEINDPSAPSMAFEARDRDMPSSAPVPALYGIIPFEQADQHIGRTMRIVTVRGQESEFKLRGVQDDRLILERSMSVGTMSLEMNRDEIETLELIE